MAEKKEKRYVSDDARLMAEWNWEKNDELGFDPSGLTQQSNKKVWWICQNRHEWQTTIAHRNRGQGCPYCSGQKVLKGFNDLYTINPDLSSEWNYEKNNGLTPAEVSSSSSKKVWWKCIEGHEWCATIASRNQGKGCPYCSGRYAIKGVNDLQTVNPDLSNEWNYEKNNGLKPFEVLPSSGKKVWWKCSKGHEWQATIDQRSKGCGCPYCKSRKVLKGYNDLQTINPILSKEWNYEKNGVFLPVDYTISSGKKVWWKCKKNHEWQATIASRTKGSGCPICSSERNTSFPEFALLYYLKKCGLDAIHSYREKGYELDIYIPSKKIAIEYDGYYWHKTKAKKDLAKNKQCKIDGIKLYRLREGLVSLNDSSVDFVVHKTQKDLSVVIQKILREIIGYYIEVDLNKDFVTIENLREHTEKENSILYTDPQIAKDWNYEKNGNLKPENFLSNSKKRVWWKCSIGHEWQETINNRKNGRGCPYCSGHKVLKGYNDLQTTNPRLAKEWNYERNDKLTPEAVTSGSNKVVWWRCCEGHEWQVRIAHRNAGSGCPYCSGRRAIKGKNDLETVNPTLSKEWNYNKNGELTPMMVLPNSNKKVWWKCQKGHEWQATIGSRNSGTGCPECAKQKRKASRKAEQK